MTAVLRAALAVTMIGAVALPAAGGGIQGKDVTGNFTVGGGYFDYDTTDGVDSGDFVFSGSAALAVALDKEWSVQFDLLGEQVTGDEDAEQYMGMQGVGAHLSYRIAGSGMVGVFAGYGSGAASDGDTWAGGWGGVEGQLWLDNVTLGVQAAVLDIGDHNGGDNEGLDDDAYLVRGIGRYFFSDDLKAEVELAYAEASNVIDGDDDGEAFEWGISVQARLAEAPLYGTLSYRNGHYDATTEGDDADVSTFGVGLSYLFGTNSLKENERSGAGLDTPSTPIRAAGVFSELD